FLPPRNSGPVWRQPLSISDEWLSRGHAGGPAPAELLVSEPLDGLPASAHQPESRRRAELRHLAGRPEDPFRPLSGDLRRRRDRPVAITLPPGVRLAPGEVPGPVKRKVKAHLPAGPRGCSGDPAAGITWILRLRNAGEGLLQDSPEALREVLVLPPERR